MKLYSDNLPFKRFIEGPGSPEVTVVAPGEPNGTTVVSQKPDGTAEPGIGVEEPEYLENDLNKKIVYIRPQDTPFDTFSRTIGNVEPCKSWEAGGWEIGVREIRDVVASAASAGANTITVDNGEMWKAGDSFLVHTADSNGEDTGVLLKNNIPVSGIVQSVAGNVLTVRGVNVLEATGILNNDSSLPAIAAGCILERLSRAVSELEASVDGFAIQPSSRKYYNQVHMAQVEESVIHALIKKEVPMDFSVYKEQTIWDMKRGMEYANILQVGGLTKDAKGDIVHLATGVWWQMSEQSTIDFSDAMTDQDWNSFCRSIFEGNNGAERRLFFAGNGLLEQIANVKTYQKQLEAKNTEMVLGLRVNKIETPFGELLVKPLGNLFQGYFSKCGMVIDPGYVKRFTMEPLQTVNLELNKTGQRRVDNAVRIHETYSLFLENLPCHRRVVPA